jgi:hypothetical protein
MPSEPFVSGADLELLKMLKVLLGLQRPDRERRHQRSPESAAQQRFVKPWRLGHTG